MPLLDPLGRTINYLRLSVTDRCNLRCTYCMPAEGIGKAAHNDILSYILGAPGTLGVITPVSHHFCSACNRIRVTASGLAKGCLFAESQFDLKPSLRTGSNLLLARALGAIVDSKPVSHQMSMEECHHQAFSMSSIGG